MNINATIALIIQDFENKVALGAIKDLSEDNIKDYCKACLVLEIIKSQPQKLYEIEQKVITQLRENLGGKNFWHICERLDKTDTPTGSKVTNLKRIK
jgi:hypothetical protein